jgi:hypothetical protein
MRSFATLLAILVCSCSPVEQPESIRTVAAYEVVLPTDNDKARFLALLDEVGEVQGYHVDSATSDELKAQSDISLISFNASVWRGEDEEMMAGAMDLHDRIGRVWLSFPRGDDPERSRRFREAVMLRVKSEWPETASLPIMPNGAIPLSEDLVRTPSGYQVKASAASRYRYSEH